MQNKHDILVAALSARDDEILGYQINIDNYQHAIARIDASDYGDLAEAMQTFRAQLVDLLQQHRVEQAKSQLLHDVIADQLGEALP